MKMFTVVDFHTSNRTRGILDPPSGDETEEF